MTIRSSNINHAARGSRGANVALALAMLASSAFLPACSDGGSSAAGEAGHGGAEETSGGKSGVAGKPGLIGAGGDGHDGEGGAAIVDCDERPTESVELNQPIWQTGFKVTLGTATLMPQTKSCSPGILVVDAQFENRGTETETFDAYTLLSSAGTDYELPYGQDLPDVPGGRLGKGSFVFEVDDTFSFDDATLSFGGAGRRQAKVPFGDNAPDPLITLEPQVLPIKGKVIAGDLTVNFEDALVRGDAPWDYSSLAADETYLTLRFNAMATKDLTSGPYLSDDAFVLMLPDGTSISPASAPFERLSDKGITVSDLWISFTLPSPARGEYVLEVRDWSGSSIRATSEFPFTLPSFPAFGEE